MTLRGKWKSTKDLLESAETVDNVKKHFIRHKEMYAVAGLAVLQFGVTYFVCSKVRDVSHTIFNGSVTITISGDNSVSSNGVPLPVAGSVD